MYEECVIDNDSDLSALHVSSDDPVLPRHTIFDERQNSLNFVFYLLKKDCATSSSEIVDSPVRIASSSLRFSKALSHPIVCLSIHLSLLIQLYAVRPSGALYPSVKALIGRLLILISIVIETNAFLNHLFFQIRFETHLKCKQSRCVCRQQPTSAPLVQQETNTAVG